MKSSVVPYNRWNFCKSVHNYITHQVSINHITGPLCDLFSPFIIQLKREWGEFSRSFPMHVNIDFLEEEPVDWILTVCINRIPFSQSSFRLLKSSVRLMRKQWVLSYGGNRIIEHLGAMNTVRQLSVSSLDSLSEYYGRFCLRWIPLSLSRIKLCKM